MPFEEHHIDILDGRFPRTFVSLANWSKINVKNSPRANSLRRKSSCVQVSRSTRFLRVHGDWKLIVCVIRSLDCAAKELAFHPTARKGEAQRNGAECQNVHNGMECRIRLDSTVISKNDEIPPSRTSYPQFIRLCTDQVIQKQNKYLHAFNFKNISPP
ncbi:hypothetical protein K0M31_005908 [Melipona bicolor]|uniref:Uncharacterized protein n=1 Tax=Melipona bicolor TaxID=60889 RepID=A0AA40KMF6_9HYME|nr:hypothetical protein K0M31_005908 [Melipona bicolor]